MIDDRIIYTGSVNMTHNGLDQNIEDCMRVSDSPNTILDAKLAFEDRWQRATIVDQTMIDKALENVKLRKSKSSPDLEVPDPSALSGGNDGTANRSECASSSRDVSVLGNRMARLSLADVPASM